ncbi:MAG: hypothetical protein R3C39_07570 [Dehalococcoidia bacterium]
MTAPLLDRTTNRRMLLRGIGLGGLGLVGAALIGCSDDDGDDATATATEAMTETATPTEAMMETGTPTAEMMDDATDFDLGAAVDYPLVEGWAKGEDVVYYDFGMRSPTSGAVVTPAPIWAFITGMDADGNPMFVEHQHNVVDTVPGVDGYSDLWEVNLVMVPEGYEADTIRSKADLDAANLEIVKPGLFVNCPIVPAGSTLENGEELTMGWYEGQHVYYPDFGPNPPNAIPIWAFITGMDASGAPIFVEGQRNIIDILPGEDGYSAFWNVNLVEVAEDYEANSITSASEVVDAGLTVIQTDLVVNCPVVTRA